eukprot:1519658-Pyramimonas_sp.AAC.1
MKAPTSLLRYTTALRAARLGDARGAIRMATGSGKLRATRHAITGRVARAGTRAPAQAARGVLVH